MYPWPLGKLLYVCEKRFIKNKLVSKSVWHLSSDKMLDQFAQVNDSLNKKLNGNLYLFENKYVFKKANFMLVKHFREIIICLKNVKRLSEVDILLYSYIRVLQNRVQFKQAAKQIEKFSNLIDFYANMDTKFNDLKI